jgi:predicted SAM-dependent methyltransferase
MIDISNIVEKDRVIPLLDNVLLFTEAEGLMIEIGCGKNKKEGFIGYDIFKHSSVDIVLKKDWRKLPIKSNSVAAIRAIHSIEHIADPINLFNEFYRVCKNKAFIYIVVPHPCSPYYYQDPTHKSFYTEKTFLKYFNGEYVDVYSDYGFKGKIIPRSVFVHGKDYSHLSIHALMEVIK